MHVHIYVILRGILILYGYVHYNKNTIEIVYFNLIAIQINVVNAVAVDGEFFV